MLIIKSNGIYRYAFFPVRNFIPLIMLLEIGITKDALVMYERYSPLLLARNRSHKERSTILCSFFSFKRSYTIELRCSGATISTGTFKRLARCRISVTSTSTNLSPVIKHVLPPRNKERQFLFLKRYRRWLAA